MQAACYVRWLSRMSQKRKPTCASSHAFAVQGAVTVYPCTKCEGMATGTPAAAPNELQVFAIHSKVTRIHGSNYQCSDPDSSSRLVRIH
ncbi:exported hypothetical protein [Arthrobacter sp. 8AJ]|nr:exported hypothetical protein [Arthrobacter sp. 8AJ]